MYQQTDENPAFFNHRPWSASGTPWTGPGGGSGRSQISGQAPAPKLWSRPALVYPLACLAGPLRTLVRLRLRLTVTATATATATVDWPPSLLPYFSAFLWKDKEVNFLYRRRVPAYSPIFIANVVDKLENHPGLPEQLAVKFTREYGEEAHRACMEVGVAPTLYACQGLAAGGNGNNNLGGTIGTMTDS